MYKAKIEFKFLFSRIVSIRVQYHLYFIGFSSDAYCHVTFKEGACRVEKKCCDVLYRD